MDESIKKKPTVHHNATLKVCNFEKLIYDPLHHTNSTKPSSSATLTTKRTQKMIIFHFIEFSSVEIRIETALLFSISSHFKLQISYLNKKKEENDRNQIIAAKNPPDFFRFEQYLFSQKTNKQK
ncbi:CLUMA_CG015927, isoform A [Clunio marinus]|uniref:CLUMA_CG015927, isoform A n=1 Tax=Clunio marinus TaxID=568069 RepID=A0A1J1IVV7_9DIPT|nr:CLUMA_CG015927, isoform A [Clunio marinus]